MTELDFFHPEAFWLIFLVIIMIILLAMTWRRKAKFYKAIADESVRPKIGSFFSKKWFWIKGSLLAAACIFFIAALAGPRGNPHYVGRESAPLEKRGDLQKKEMEIAFFLDVSSSMGVRDMRLKKTRLEFAKEIINEIIKGLRQESVSLHLFTSEVEKRVPNTIDYLYTRLALSNVELNQIGAEGTDISKTVSEIIHDAVHEKKGKMTAFVVLTDGESTEGTIPKNLDFTKEMGPNKSNVFLIGMGSKEGGVVPDVEYQGHKVISKRDDEAMERLKASFKGQYYIAENSSPLLIARRFLNEIEKNPQYVKAAPIETKDNVDQLKYDEYFPYPLIMGLLLYIMALNLPGTKRTLMIPLIFFNLTFLNADENDLLIKARTLIEAGDFLRADELLKSGEESAQTNWQKQYFFYDRALGTILKDIQKIQAMPMQEVSPLRYSFPPVGPKADYTHAYALFLMMKNAFLIKEKNPRNVEILRMGVRLGVQINKSIKQFIIDDCRLNKIKGAKNCQTPRYVLNMLKLSEIFKLEILRKYYAMRGQFFTPIEALLQFLIGHEMFIKTLKALKNLEPSDSLDAYLLKLSKEAETFHPIVERFKNGEEGDLIAKQYAAFIEFLKQADVIKAEELAQKILINIRALMETLFSKQEAIEALYELFEAYQEAYLEENLSLNTLKLLSLKQEETFKLPGVQESVPKELLDYAQMHLKKATLIVQSGNQDLAESEFLFADFAIKSSIFYTIDLNKVSSRILLRLYISLMNTLASQDSLADVIASEKEWDNSLLFNLETILNKTVLFDKVSLREEIAAFEAQSAHHPDGSSCVASPWEVVLPYFDEGRKLLERSKNIVQFKGFESNWIIPLHSETIENWLLALNALDNPQSPTSCPGGGGGRSEEGKDKTSTGGEGIDQVLQNIVRMGEDDKEFEAVKVVKKEKETTKPW